MDHSLNRGGNGVTWCDLPHEYCQECSIIEIQRGKGNKLHGSTFKGVNERLKYVTKYNNNDLSRLR